MERLKVRKVSSSYLKNAGGVEKKRRRRRRRRREKDKISE